MEGIIADVNLLYKGELEYLQIIVDKYLSLISFRGKYYYWSVEKIDDVGIENRDEKTAIQTKSALSDRNSVSDRAVDLWKTLYN